MEEDLLANDDEEGLLGKKFASAEEFHAWFEEYKLERHWSCHVKKNQFNRFEVYCPNQLKQRAKGTRYVS